MGDRTVLDLYRHDVEAPRDEHYAHWTPGGKRTLSTGEFFRRTCALATDLRPGDHGRRRRWATPSTDR